MALLKISRLGHPVLRERAAPLTRQQLMSPDMQRLIEDMVETMRDANGVGLAAPQVYVSTRVLVAEPAADDEKKDRGSSLIVLANPEITSASRDVEDGWEGCLSIPDLRGQVPRHKKVTVTGLSRLGKEVSITAEGFAARVLQHEIDHLDGVIFLERMKDLSTLTYLEEWQRYWAREEE
jgi:peptide deformylase